ncbi:hypothetical protein V5799_025929 [Amblyomma americanum]|uniref:Prolylcarboxypeptidase n=1 Tax=Amblyomma americanum TaxID=6943 RepID=A0AAQ4DK18_AMBAM
MAILQVSLVITLGTWILFAGAKEVSYKEHWLRTKVDHFAFHNNHSFELRYLMCDKYWDRDGGPIFIYTGNENRIDAFAESAGALWEWAPEFGALIIFAEHRFFGQSLPFGKDSFVSPQNLGYLTSDQALADYADLLLHLKYTLPGAERSPVVAFGGSYGGLLAAWMRLKYPHIVDAHEKDETLKIFKMTAVRKRYRVKRLRLVVYAAVKNYCAMTGSAYLQRKFNMCQPLHPSNYTLLRDMLRDTYGVIAMSNYADASELVGALTPSPVKEVCKHFINAPETKLGLVDAAADAMGAYLTINGTRRCLDVFLYERGLDSYQFLGIMYDWALDFKAMLVFAEHRYYGDSLPYGERSFTEACRFLWNPLQTGEDLIRSLHKAASILYNSSGNAACYSIDGNVGVHAGWMFQTCTELVMPECSNGAEDMFQPKKWDIRKLAKRCRQRFGVTPNPGRLKMLYGGSDLRDVSNVIFTLLQLSTRRNPRRRRGCSFALSLSSLSSLPLSLALCHRNRLRQFLPTAAPFTNREAVAVVRACRVPDLACVALTTPSFFVEATAPRLLH